MNSGRSGSHTSSDESANDDSLDLYESNTHAFIVKIWLEETAQEAGRATWRGHITHVPSGERRYVKYMREIVAFIAGYLEKMGVDRRWRVCRWFDRWNLW
jgi:hypothetical protein